MGREWCCPLAPTAAESSQCLQPSTENSSSDPSTTDLAGIRPAAEVVENGRHVGLRPEAGFTQEPPG